MAKCYDNVPINNLRHYELRNAMANNVSAEKWNELTKDDTIFHNLTWKASYSLKTDDGADTVYAKFMNME